MKQTELAFSQKLAAIALKYYDDFKWNPKKGDYYTSTRNDLELYQIVDEGEQFFYTKYCDPKKGIEISEWPKATFLKDFGLKRVFVPDWILNSDKPQASSSGHEVYPDCFQTGKCKSMCMICLNY
jgi:hypothetical protein